MNNQNNGLSGDKPLSDPKDDRLGYAPFAQHLAKSLSSMSTSEGLVVAIYGPWGSGKTTALNFVMHFLKGYVEKGQIVPVPFNPWLFSGTEDITRRFFDQIIAVLAKRKASSKELRKKIAHFADMISETPVPYSSVGKVISRLTSPREKDIVRLKTEVETILKKENKRLLVIIDDIDRLSAEEHRHIFQLIKAVADFPNVTYLLAFDKQVASNALAAIQGQSGDLFLEKIVQVPFELPLPDKASLRRLLFDILDGLLEITPVVRFDQAYWTNVYFEGIDHFITTPRAIVRLTNTLSVTYPAVKGEVNPVDFIAIEALRVFCPVAYDVIRRNPESFAGYFNYGVGQTERKTLDEFHDAWMKRVSGDDQVAVKNLIKRLFPKLESNYGADFAADWRRKLRVCSQEKFVIYFRLAFPLGMITNNEMLAFLRTTSDSLSFGEQLVRASDEKRGDGTTRVSELLERLADYTEDEIPQENISAILNAFFDIGDRLLKEEDEGRGLLSFGNDARIARVIFKLLKRIDELERFVLLSRGFRAGRSIGIMEDLVVTLGQQHGKWTRDKAIPEEERLVSAEHLAELEAITLEKIRAAARNYELLASKHLPSILYRWREWGGEVEMKSWVQQTVSSDEGMIEFIERFLHKTYSQTLGDAAIRTVYRLDPKNLEPFLDPSSLIERIEKVLGEKHLSDNQKRALTQCLKEYKIRAEGKSPDAVLRS